MSQRILPSLFAQKAWANRELYEVLAGLPPEQATTLQGAVRTLNHIHVVDCIFRAHLSGEPHGYSGTHTAELPSLDALRFAVAETDAWYEDHVARISDEALAAQVRFTFTDGEAGCMSREEMLFHVLTHGAYHRGNVGQMLKAISVAPPRDLLTKFLHQREPARRT